MKITQKIYATLVAEAANYAEAEAYASDLALSSIWQDGEEAMIPEERFPALVQLHGIITKPFRELLAMTGLSQSALARRFSVPLRTVQNWCAPDGAKDRHECPVYIRLMMAECLGLLPVQVAL